MAFHLQAHWTLGGQYAFTWPLTPAGCHEFSSPLGQHQPRKARGLCGGSTWGWAATQKWGQHPAPLEPWSSWGAVSAHPRGPVSREGWLGTVLCEQHQAWGAGIPRRPVKGPCLRLCPRWGGKKLQQPAWGPVKPWTGRRPGTASPTTRSRPWGTEALDSTGRQVAAQTHDPVWLQCSSLRLWVPTCVWNP